MSESQKHDTDFRLATETVQTGEGKSKLHLDTILVEEVGQFGLYQLKVVLSLSVIAIFTAWSMNDYVFTAARINYRCFIPECDGENPMFAPPWIWSAVPGDNQTSFDSCKQYGNLSSLNNEGNCTLETFQHATLMSCERFVYESTDTVVYDFNLACDEWTRSMIGSVQTMGTLLSLPINGYMSDRWGRRAMLVVCSFSTALVGTTRYWTNTFTGFMTSVVIEAVIGTGYNSGYILLTELVGPKYRVVAGAAMNSFFSIGLMLLGLIAWLVPNWRNLTLVLYVPQLITIAYIWIVSESVRWYMAKGRYKEAEIVLKEVARINKKQLSEKSSQSLCDMMEHLNKRKSLESKQVVVKPWLIEQIFKNKPMLLRCLVTPLWWVSFTLVYYGLSINAVNMYGNQYLNYIVVSAMEVPGFWIAVWLMNKIGRRPVLIGAYCICAVCLIGYIFVPKNMPEVSLVLYLVGKCSIAGAVMAVFVYTAELYPTWCRHTLFSYSSMVGRIGAIVAPLTPAIGAVYWEQLPFVLFASFCLLSGLLTLLMPETLGTKLPETMEEASVLNI